MIDSLHGRIDEVKADYESLDDQLKELHLVKNDIEEESNGHRAQAELYKVQLDEKNVQLDEMKVRSTYVCSP
jgi:chromosome segregation ATPase